MGRSQSALDIGGGQPDLFTHGQRPAKSFSQRALKIGSFSARMTSSAGMADALNSSPRPVAGMSSGGAAALNAPANKAGGSVVSRQSESMGGGVQRRSSAPVGSGNSDWPGLFQEEQTARKADRVNGAGVGNGTRSKASTGIAWRELPQGKPASAQDASGCGHMSAGGVPMPRRGVSQFSPRHQGAGMKGALSSVDEHQANLENYRPQTKGVTQEFNTKEMCPFYREDSVPESRGIHPVTPHKRELHSASLTGNLAGGGFVTPLENQNQVADTTEPYELQPGEKCVEARRDWASYQQAPQSTMLSRSLSQRSVGGDSINSATLSRSLSAQTIQSVVNPVHSVRARPSAEARPKWK